MEGEGGAAVQELRLPALATDDVESPSAAAGSNVQPIFKTESRFISLYYKKCRSGAAWRRSAGGADIGISHKYRWYRE